MRKILASSEIVVGSVLVALEFDRVLRRGVAVKRFTEAEAAVRSGAFARASSPWSLFRIDDDIVRRARAPFPVEPLRTLDAIHLATALTALTALPRLAILSLDGRIRDNAEALGLTVVP
jgi:predicted nucleic acid-binding protein